MASKCAFTLVLVMSFCRVWGSDPTERVAKVSDSNRISIDSIQTVSCRYSTLTTQSHGKTEQTLPAAYWKSNSVVREFVRNGDQWGDELCVDGVVSSKSTYLNEKGKIAIAGSISSSSSFALGIDRFAENCLFVFVRGNAKPPVMVGFGDLLKSLPHKIINTTSVTEQGRELVKVEVEFEPNSLNTYWFDIGYNYLVKRVKLDYISPFTKNRENYVREVQKFYNAGNGVYFPELITVTHADPEGKVFSTTTVTITDIRVNKPIPPSDLTLTFPPGTEVHNHITNKISKVAADGKIIDTGESIRQPSPPVSPSANIATPQVMTHEKTVEREPLINRILPYLSLVLLLGACAVFFYRRRVLRKLEQE